MKDVLGTAISDYHNGITTHKLWVHNEYGPKENMPINIYFRDMEQMPELEWVALQQCRGSILDIGAGAGSHALALQKMEQEVTALDISEKAGNVMRARGVENVITKDFFRLETVHQYDTLLMLMNGIGLAGTIEGLKIFLQKAKALLKPNGQLIFDSSDIAYLYDGKPPKGPKYYGEVNYQYAYRRNRSDWFNWLFIDRKTLTAIAKEEGWSIQLLFEDPHDQYLVRCQTLAQ